MYDCVVVGTGFCGSILACELASKLNKKVLVLEKRNHIAGNMYEEIDSSGIRVQKYGPHSFHTNNKNVFDYLQKFAKFEPFELKCRVMVDGITVPSPFNFEAVELMFDKEKAFAIKHEIRKEYGNKEKTTILELLKSKNKVIKQYAEYLFNKDYKPYTIKQWGLKPEELDISILQRVPILFNYDDRYFDDEYQAMPINGFTDLLGTMLKNDNITLKLGEDVLNEIDMDEKTNLVKYPNLKQNGIVIFTGAADALFQYKFGALPYRSLLFKYKTLNQEYYQDAPIVAYPFADGYTRITEYKRLPMQKCKGKTIIAEEYPLQYDMNNIGNTEPYYPIINDSNNKKYALYLQEAQKYTNLYLCGRLADYKYYNMDKAIERALDVYEKIKKEWLA